MLGIAYLTLSAMMFVIIILGFYKSLKLTSQERKRKTSLVAIILLSWIIYLALLDRSHVLQDNSLPPKFLLLVFVPFVIFLLTFFVRFKNDPSIHAIPVRWPIYYQTFRIFVEILLLYTYMEEIIPIHATFEGLNFDILMGISAPLVAIFIYRKENIKKPLAIIWNVLGCVMILFVAFIIMTSFYFPKVWGNEVSLVSGKFVSMPFILLAAFLAPSGIFMHILALMQLRKK